MTDYFQFVPDEAPATVEEIEQGIREQLSMQVSPNDDPAEFAHEVAITRQPHYSEGRGAGVMVTGTIDRDPVADYLGATVDPGDYQVDGAVAATEADPVDLTPEQLEAHLDERDNRGV